MNSPKLCHRFLLISGRLDEHGLFQCTQGGRNQPGTGSTLFTRVRRRFSCEYDSPLGRDRTAAWLHAQSCPLENCSRLAGKLQLWWQASARPLIYWLVPTVQDTLGRLMFQDMLFPEGHHLSCYHYSGDSLSRAPWRRLPESASLFVSLFAVRARNGLTLTGLICSQAPTAGRLRRSDTSTKGLRPTERTSSWCRNW